MILANINLGSAVNAGDGDKLYTAFTKINQNFANIMTSMSGISNSVTSVSGRSGNVILTTQDIIGMNNYITSLSIDGGAASTIYGTTSLTLNGGGA